MRAVSRTLIVKARPDFSGTTSLKSPLRKGFWPIAASQRPAAWPWTVTGPLLQRTT